MSKYIINGKNILDGSIELSGAKNSVLPLLSAGILTDEKVYINNCPKITDVYNMIEILREIGCVINWRGRTLEVDSSAIKSGDISLNVARELRSSIFLLGPLLGRLKCATAVYPGGCEIGMRPIDLHLKAFAELNIAVREEGGHIFCNSESLRPQEIILDIPSVGATENIIMATVLSKGRTVIRNSAKEPEIVDLSVMLNKMGAKIRGAGTSVITVDGVGALHGVEHTPIPDRIAGGTYLIACYMCGGRMEIKNVVPEHIFSLISKFDKYACNVTYKNGNIYMKSNGGYLNTKRIDTMYYPGFPTDLQSQFMASQLIGQGTCVLQENIFETRYKQVPEFIKMGADIIVKDRIAVVRGVSGLHGGEVRAEDLRGGASLVLAGLTATGRTVVCGAQHIDRGYENLDGVLRAVGADIIKS